MLSGDTNSTQDTLRTDISILVPNSLAMQQFSRPLVTGFLSYRNEELTGGDAFADPSVRTCAFFLALKQLCLIIASLYTYI